MQHKMPRIKVVISKIMFFILFTSVFSPKSNLESEFTFEFNRMETGNTEMGM